MNNFRYPLKLNIVGYNKKFYPKESVIYKIVNTVNEKIYIGQTVNFRKRLKHHKHSLVKGIHCSNHLQKSFNKNGIDCFYAEIIEFVPVELLTEREQYWLDFYKSYNPKYGYNIASTADSYFYGKRTKQHRLNIGKSIKGLTRTDESKTLMSIVRTCNCLNIDPKLYGGIGKFNLNNILICIYPTLKEAVKDTNILRTSIGNNLHGFTKTAGGFIWKYIIKEV